MHFSRHARNQMRRLGLSEEDLVRLTGEPEHQDEDPDGRARYTARIRGRRFRVIVAVDNPDFVVTVHERRN